MQGCSQGQEQEVVEKVLVDGAGRWKSGSGVGRQQGWMQEEELLVFATVLQNLSSPDLTQQKTLRSGFGGLT